MEKKPKAMPLSSLFTGDMKRLRFELSLPTMEPALREAIEDERDGCAAKFATGKLKQSPINSKNAKTLKKPHVTREALETYRQQYMLEMQAKEGWPEGRDHGWKADACKRFKTTRKTLDARLKGN